MTPDERVPAKYNLRIVEAATLELAAELHPERSLSKEQLAEEVVGDPGDSKEAEVVAQAIRNLHERGLLHSRDGETIEPTPVALRAVALLTR